MSQTPPPDIIATIQRAINLIRSVPSYADDADTLLQLLMSGKIRYVPTLEDRAHAGLLGTITLGPEPFAPDAALLGLAETLIHELFHLRQNPLEKTASYWKGVLTGTDVMLRYERPAYQSGLDFLKAYQTRTPSAANEAEEEMVAVRDTFATAYGSFLS